jgi:hypothetical protein
MLPTLPRKHAFEILYFAPRWQRVGFRFASLLSFAQLAAAIVISRSLLLRDSHHFSELSRWQRDALGSALIVTASAVSFAGYNYCVKRAASVALVQHGAREMLRVVPLSLPYVARLVSLESLAPMARLQTRQSRANLRPPHALLSTQIISAPPALATVFEKFQLRWRSRPAQFILDSRGTFTDETRFQHLLSRGRTPHISSK